MPDMPPVGSPDQIRSHLEQLQREFAGRLPARFDDMRRCHAQLGASGWTTQEAETLHRLVHSLTGSAGTFGMRNLSDTARQVEVHLARMLRQGDVPDRDEWNAIGEGIERMAEMALSRPDMEAQSAHMPLLPAVAASGSVVHLVMDDRVQAGALRAALQEGGHRVCLYEGLKAFRRDFVHRSDAATEVVVLDVAFAPGDPGGAGLLRDLRLGQQWRTPVVVALDDGALAARLAFSRAGASRTLVRPLDPDRLGDALNMLTGRQPRQAYRVLLVDDDPVMLEVQAGALRAVGMQVRAISQPLHTLEELDRFQPDVLLLDVYMPDASGPELAAVLRENEAHLHLPIVFLSAETDMTQQLLALNLGGDDFLVKPVQPAHLVAAVTARARRARQGESLRQRLQTTVYERDREHLALDQHAIVSIANGEGNITYANDLFCQVSGYRRRELLGMNHRLLSSPQNGKGFIRSIWHSISEGRVWHGEIRCVRKDGSSYWVESTITPFLNSAGRVYQYVAIQTDISHIKAAEATLRAQRDMQRVISEAAARLMAAPSADTQDVIYEAMRHSGEQLGADRSYLFRFSGTGALDNTQVWSAPGMDPMDDSLKTTPVEGTPWLRQQFERHGILNVPDVQALPPEAALDRARMEERQIRAFLAFPLQRNGQIFGFIGYSAMRQRRDWTSDEIELLKVLADVVASAVARKLAEAALRESESRLNFLVSSSPVVIYTRSVEAPHAAAYVSPNVRQLMGFEPEALTNDPEQGLGLVHPDDRGRMSRELPLILSQGVDLSEYRLRRADGSYRWVQDQRRLARDAQDRPVEIIGYWLDITERKRIEHELLMFNRDLEQRVAEQTRSVIESERFARATLDALSARVVILDSEGRVLAANRAWEAFGALEMVQTGSSYLDICDSTCAADNAVGQPLANGIRAVIQGDASEFLHEYLCRREAEPRWFLCRVERFPGDGAVRAVVSHENITQMKLIERQQLRSQRLESLGTLAGGVAHDLNNALAPVLMGMAMLKEQYPEEPRMFDMIRASAQRGADMVRQLLTFAKGVEGERVPVSPERLVHELHSLMRGSFPKNIQLQVDSGVGVPMVIGDATQLHQILLNLCVNARDAMLDGGVLSLGAQSIEIDAGYARSVPDARPGLYVCWRVSDTGSGIPPEVLDRIFDPFFTTKSPDRGTGLGLSTVLGIVKSHGGFVQVYSPPGCGATFSVYLPADVSGNVAAAPEAASVFRGQGETVLFVDDEAAVREVGRSVLRRLNFEPLVAVDGADGLVQVAQHRHVLRAVITDLHMPHMDGVAFVRALRQAHPDLPVVIASGRVDDSVAQSLDDLGVTSRLDKPFSENQMAKVLSELLVAREPSRQTFDTRNISVS
ncbi:response regulator [Hydrogenophaga sp.]|uniref:response regulator n=1 Tax=Hydrogenophaga sp. TaxID=1904254 RepID=UPI00262DE298|nr:response regulator [Hydrogenophaga sp.]MDM7949326.1 response regulator [Hydrogenophaga sp.]